MDKIELANKLYKTNQSGKKNRPNLKSMDKKATTSKDSTILPSKAASNKPDISKKFPDIRMDLVNKYKEDINNGTYKLKTDEIAEKIIQKYKEQTYYKHSS